MFRIIAFLPVNRAAQGWLHLFGHDGAKLTANIPVRGKADNARAAAAGNAGRDPTLPYGDTPSGVYAPSRILPLAPPHPRIGALFLPLEGASGDAHLAKLRGRTGLGLHAGRGDGNLVATYGCLRVRDCHMAEIYDIVGGDEVLVTVHDVGESNTARDPDEGGFAAGRES